MRGHHAIVLVLQQAVFGLTWHTQYNVSFSYNSEALESEWVSHRHLDTTRIACPFFCPKVTCHMYTALDWLLDMQEHDSHSTAVKYIVVTLGVAAVT